MSSVAARLQTFVADGIAGGAIEQQPRWKVIGVDVPPLEGSLCPGQLDPLVQSIEPCAERLDHYPPLELEGLGEHAVVKGEVVG